MSLHDDNLAKISELKPEVQWAALAWLQDCEKYNLQFRISEAYRTLQRQQELYAQGRTKPGHIVTYDDGIHHVSQHQLRLALDCYPINCAHLDIVKLAIPYGITHPFGFDPPHYSFTKVAYRPVESQPAEPVIHLSQDAEKRAFARGIDRMPAGNAKDRAVQRFFKRYGVPYTLVLPS